MKKYPQRTKVVDYLKAVLYGPRDGDDEIVEGTPFLRYMTGILFPAQQEVSEGEGTAVGSVIEEVVDAAASSAEEGEEERGLELAFEMLQAAVGLSFRVPEGATIRCATWAARYVMQDGVPSGNKRGRASKRWRREALATPDHPEVALVSEGQAPIMVFGGRAHVEARWRSHGDGTAVVTVTLVNRQVSAGRGLDPAMALFQVGLHCEVDGGQVLPYPEVGTSHLPGSEEAEVAFLYKEESPFARGHGASATWADPLQQQAAWVAIEFVPAVDVPAPTFDIKEGGVDPRCLQIQFLDTGKKDDILTVLETLPRGYRQWIERKRSEAKGQFDDVATMFVQRAEGWCSRIDKGLAILRDDANAWRAFQLANRAMGMQMILGREGKRGPYPARSNRGAPSFLFGDLKWRPFQIAFMLASVESVWNEESVDRETVDVIWFPTGGGKTEAYLFVTALELVRRRMVHGERDTATGVISRYTLRMLTAQQFQRTAGLVLALELLRRSEPRLLGARPFSLGLWAGGDVTPNRFRQAHKKLEECLQAAKPENPFQLQACPCCGTELFPSKPQGHPGNWNMEQFGFVSTQGSFELHCPSVSCPFHESLPINVVDDALYAMPPSVLIGTMDKFAQLPWDDSARVFFGGIDDESAPPSLILQDELHLISGPLGSISAPYEAAIETIIRLRGTSPKRIASTATIRNAREQVRALYGRESAVFPTPCGSWREAFFFSINEEAFGRTYVGVMGQGYTKPVVAMSWTAAALLQAPMEVDLDKGALDAYWTLLAYHNSRRELGRTLTAARDEIESRVKVVASPGKAARRVNEPLELSSHMVKSMAEAMESLERSHASQKPAVDLVPCTNIISVGVDVGRLGLMLMNGQPKLTSEYIQASSRVGRAEVPGLVVTLFSPSKPRDRSHYEDFRAYHEALYRFVEPTSVTPYALPSRERTLHAALVALVRHALQWPKAGDASKVDFDDPSTNAAIDKMVELMCIADPAEAEQIRSLAARRIEEWRGFAEVAGDSLLYESRQAPLNFPALLFDYGKLQGRGYWPAMNSVRNVDSETAIVIK